MEKMNFYTENGWAGKNYDGKLTTKEITAKARQYAKEKHPGYKFSITAGWSTHTPLITIRLKGGPCTPFIWDRTYLNTSASYVSGHEKDLAPGVYAALEGVCSYVQSFNYNDCDAMTDYFDVNFYTEVIIDSRDYGILVSRDNKASAGSLVSGRSRGLLEVVEYSGKAVAVFGDTREIKGQLKGLGGRFNPALRHDGEKRAGWIFSRKHEAELRKVVKFAVAKA